MVRQARDDARSDPWRMVANFHHHTIGRKVGQWLAFVVSKINLQILLTICLCWGGMANSARRGGRSGVARPLVYGARWWEHWGCAGASAAAGRYDNRVSSLDEMFRR